MWSLRYTTEATAGIYLIPRGPAAMVTEAIRALQRLPVPYEATLEPTGRPNTYVLTIAEYNITYELVEQEQIVKILLVEEA